MTRFSLLGTASLAALVLAAPLHADVTADDIWGDWQSYMTSFGYEMTGTETRSGNTLTVSAVSMSFDMSGEGDPVGVVTMTMPAMTFTENGDGTVSVGMPGESEIVFVSAEGAPEAVRAVISYSQPGFAMTASGAPNAVDYVYSADRMAMALTELTVEGETLPAEALTAEMAIAGVSGQTALRIDGLRRYDQTLSYEAVTLTFDFTDPDGDESGKVNFAAEGMRFAGVSTIPDIDLGAEIVTALQAGFAVDGGFSLTGSSSDLAFTGPDAFTANTSADTTEYRIAMAADGGLVYDITHSGVALNMLVPDFPLPITAQMASSAFKLALPVVKSDDPQDFGLTIEMNELEVAEGLWGMFDPAAQLPRDPATLQVSIDGLAKLLFNFLDPAEAEAIGASGAMPAELQSVNLGNLVLSAAGAALTGNGAFTVTPGLSPIFGPLGTPVGQVDLELVGGNGLMDKLVAMGLLPEEQAMGARMMMGLFARPGEGADTLTSTIEINADGHILANGQRIQ
ncbi:MAG: DUF2125 domain-containing protein [Pseudomonadota bacterium]